MPSIIRMLLLSVMALMSAQALAHSTVKSTVPASGSIVPASPAEIVIHFNEPARLISVVVASAGKPDRKVDFTPSGSAMSFKVPSPQLVTGRNEIQWKALSKDGHPISGTILIVVKPGAPASSPPAGSQPHEKH